MRTIQVVPAYGRDYKSKAEIIAAWKANMDFLVADVRDKYDGKPINREDARQAGIQQIKARYAKQRKVTFIAA